MIVNFQNSLFRKIPLVLSLLVVVFSSCNEIEDSPFNSNGNPSTVSSTNPDGEPDSTPIDDSQPSENSADTAAESTDAVSTVSTTNPDGEPDSTPIDDSEPSENSADPPVAPVDDPSTAGDTSSDFVPEPNPSIESQETIPNEIIPVTIAENGVAKFKIVVSDTATTETKENANTLAEYLKRITGATFEVITGNGLTDIAFGLDSDFPALSDMINLYPETIHDREKYFLKSHPQGLYLLGATEKGVVAALWGFIYGLGYRQYFPGDHWEYVPQISVLSIAENKIVTPAFHKRSLAISYGAFLIPEMDETYSDWSIKNLRSPGAVIQTTHRYAAIKSAYPTEFASHPEYSPQNGTGTGLCVYNPDVVALATEFTKDYFDDNPSYDAASLTPNDSGSDATWAGCPDDRPTSTTDKALYFANEVAKNLKNTVGYEDKMIGMLAYNDTSTPPETLTVEDNVRIFAATSYIQNGLSYDDVVRGWLGKDAVDMGARSYLCVYSWTSDLPGQNGIMDLNTLVDQMLKYSGEYGLNYYTAEHCDGFGAVGLAYYLMTQLLQNPQLEGSPFPVDQMYDEFLNTMFESAKDAMKEFYDLLTPHGQYAPFNSTLIGDLYRALNNGLAATDNPEVENRIRDLALYVRYTELYYIFTKNIASTTLTLDQKTDQLNAIVEFSYRTRRTHMLPFRSIVTSLDFLDTTSGDQIFNALKTKTGCSFTTIYSLTKSKTPVYADTMYTNAEIESFITQGSNLYPAAPWERVAYSENLLPAYGNMTLNDVPTGRITSYANGDQEFQMYAKSDQLSFSLTLKSGYIKTYVDDGPVEINIYSATDNSKVYSFLSPTDSVTRTANVILPEEGQYVLKLENNRSGTYIAWPINLPVAKYIDDRFKETGMHPTYDAAFYVPKGTTVIGGILNGGNSEVVDPNGTVVSNIKRDEMFSIAVPTGQDGKLWRFRKCTNCRLYTVPPLVFLDEKQTLLPSEVIEADR